MDVAATYCEFQNQFLILKRHPDRPQGNLWGLPAGKLESGELPVHGAVRELYEETGLKLNANELTSLGHLYVKHPDWDFIFHLFYKNFDHRPELILALEERLEARWINFEEALELPLISGGHESLQFAYEKIKEFR